MDDGPDEIYDSVPEDMLKGEENEEGIFEDIYDIPEGMCTWRGLVY